MSRVSKVTKTFEIIVNIGNFENIKVGTTTVEDISWDNIKERNEKAKNLSEKLFREVARDVSRVLKIINREKMTNIRFKFDENETKINKEQNIEDDNIENNIESNAEKLDKKIEEELILLDENMPVSLNEETNDIKEKEKEKEESDEDIGKILDDLNIDMTL